MLSFSAQPPETSPPRMSGSLPGVGVIDSLEATEEHSCLQAIYNPKSQALGRSTVGGLVEGDT